MPRVSEAPETAQAQTRMQGLREFAKPALDVEGRTARQIFGPGDEMKFRSSMTQFVKAAPDEALHSECLEKFFGGEPDPVTLKKL